MKTKTKTLVTLIAGVALILAAGTGPVAGFGSHPAWSAEEVAKEIEAEVEAEDGEDEE